MNDKSNRRFKIDSRWYVLFQWRLFHRVNLMKTSSQKWYSPHRALVRDCPWFHVAPIAKWKLPTKKMRKKTNGQEGYVRKIKYSFVCNERGCPTTTGWNYAAHGENDATVYICSHALKHAAMTPITNGKSLKHIIICACWLYMYHTSVFFTS